MERSNVLENAQGRASVVINQLVPDENGKEFNPRSLFNFTRFSRPLTLFDKLLLAFYAPFGIFLTILRFILFFTVMSSGGLLPKRIARSLVPWLVQRILGCVLRIKNKDRLDNAAPVVVGNHITDYDPFILAFMRGELRPVISAKVKTIPVVGALMAFAYSPWDTLWVPVKVQGQDLRNKVRDDILSHLKGGHAMPIGILPEGGLTNGKVGTMIFKKFVFSLGLKVTPIAIRHSSPLPINTDWLGTQWLWNILWGMFVPWHIYDIDVLPEMAIREGEDDAQFAKRVQAAVSESIGIIPTNFVYEDKAKLRQQSYVAWKQS